MPAPFLDLPDGASIRLRPRGGLSASVHVIEEDSVLAINAALATGRPLLVRGEPGTGKSQLARAAAEALGRAFVPHVVDARTETRDLLWTVDAVARLAKAQIMGALRDVADIEKSIDVLRFTHPGPLWWAFDWASAREQAGLCGAQEPATPEGWVLEHGAVVLVDEIDKADASVPNGLLDALGHGRFDVPGREAVTVNAVLSPLVVITTNEERALPDAFLRRCFVLHLGLPDDPVRLRQTLTARGRAHFPVCADSVLVRAAELLANDRDALRLQDLAPPGLAEYIDLVRAVTEQRREEVEQLGLLDRIAKFALQKHPPEAGK
jgi:MoxR-like ATPase